MRREEVRKLFSIMKNFNEIKKAYRELTSQCAVIEMTKLKRRAKRKMNHFVEIKEY